MMIWMMMISIMTRMMVMKWMLLNVEDDMNDILISMVKWMTMVFNAC